MQQNTGWFRGATLSTELGQEEKTAIDLKAMNSQVRYKCIFICVCVYKYILETNTVHMASTRSDSEGRQVAPVYLSWQHRTSNRVRSHKLGVSECHSCVAISVWRCLGEWHSLLLLSGFVCHRENIEA